MRTWLRDYKELLLMEQHLFDFDISNQSFVNFFEERTGYMITKCQCGWNEVLKCIETPPNPSWTITRAKLQDCWELFTQKVEIPEKMTNDNNPHQVFMEL